MKGILITSRIKVRSTDIVGLSTVSDNFTIHYSHSTLSDDKVAKTHSNQTYTSYDNTGKSDDEGICTYRVSRDMFFEDITENLHISVFKRPILRISQ